MIVVTTPTGNIGLHALEHLLNADEAVRVIARNAGKLPQAIRDRVEVVEGSHGDAAVVNRAFDGAEAVFWVAPPTPSETLEDTYINFTRPAADAISRHGVSRVVLVTALGRGTAWQDRAGLVTASIKMADLLNETGAAVRGLAMPGFMENALQQLQAIQQGQMFGPLDPDKKVPHTATRDMGAAAARLLRDRSWTGQEDVPLLGPQDLSFNEVAAIVSEIFGREVRYQQVPFDGFKAQLISRGMSEAFAQGYVDMMRAKNEGMDNVVERSSTNIGPTTYRQWAEDELKPALASKRSRFPSSPINEARYYSPKIRPHFFETRSMRHSLPHRTNNNPIWLEDGRLYRCRALPDDGDLCTDHGCRLWRAGVDSAASAEHASRDGVCLAELHVLAQPRVCAPGPWAVRPVASGADLAGTLRISCPPRKWPPSLQ